MANDKQKRARLAWRKIQKQGYPVAGAEDARAREPYVRPSRMSSRHGYTKKEWQDKENP
jgi:hypothetical protein